MESSIEYNMVEKNYQVRGANQRGREGLGRGREGEGKGRILGAEWYFSLEVGG